MAVQRAMETLFVAASHKSHMDSSSRYNVAYLGAWITNSRMGIGS
jgi:hypothetical protein